MGRQSGARKATFIDVQCQQCGTELSDDARFCAACGAPRRLGNSTQHELTTTSVGRAGKKTRAPEWRWSAVTLALIIGGVGAIAWNVPTSTSDLKHHEANETSYLSTKAYDEGADFFIFNRCNMFVIVDGKKYTFSGDDQNDECVFANPADALKIAAYIRAGD